MLKTYKVVFHGSCEDIQTMTRVFDKVFRSKYWTLGGKHEKSWKDSEGYCLEMSYTANWETNWWNAATDSLTWETLKKVVDLKLNRQHFQWSEMENDGKGWYEVR